MSGFVSSYVDSGVLIKMYVLERNSARAIELICRQDHVVLTPLQELEMVNTIHTLTGRGVITQAQKTAAEHHLALDAAAGRLRRTNPDAPGLYREALELSRQFSSSTLARSPDILHVACALVLQIRGFITANKRQYDLAMLAGLDCRFLA